MRVYFCIKIVLREKNIDFFFVVIKNMIVCLGGNAKKYTVGYMSAMLEYFFLFFSKFRIRKNYSKT